MNVTSLTGLESGISPELHIAFAPQEPAKSGKARRSPGDCAGDDIDIEMDGETAANGDLNACQPTVILESAQKVK